MYQQDNTVLEVVYFLDQLRNNTDQCLVLQILPTLSSVSPSKKSSGQWVHTHLLWYQCYIVQKMLSSIGKYQYMLLSLAVGKFPFSIIGSDLIHTLGYHAVIMVMFINILQTCSRSSSWRENVHTSWTSDPPIDP